MKHWLVILSFLLLSCCIGCDSHKEVRMSDLPDKPIVVVFENDVHCAVDGYAKLVTVREQQRALTPYVSTVSCGDFIQGDVVGSLSHGEKIVEIMDKVGYDAITLGNHEFDYGVSRLFKLTEDWDSLVVSTNFCNHRTGELVFPAYRMIRYGEVDIAYLGFTTTTTATSVAARTFLDEAGNILYDFSKSNFYENAQKQIDQARKEGADYVVVLSHLGDTYRGDSPSSIGLITHTTGINVVLDGHDHRVIPDSLVLNKEGIPVLLTSTGTKFENVGVLTLSMDGTFESRLIPLDSVSADDKIQLFVDEIKEKTMADGRVVVGVNEVTLSILDASGMNLARCNEVGIGNFCSDAFRLVLNTDVAMINGGGIRVDLPAGDVTYNHLLSMFPFNNTACIATLTGQQLVDALEFSVSFLPKMDGSFMQVSGIRFEVDSIIPSPILVDQHQMFAGVGEGKRRVSQVEIWDRKTQTYQPIDPNREYTLASFDYQIKKLGNSGILRYAKLKDDYLGQDVDVLASYITNFLNGRIEAKYKETEGRIRIK